MRRRGIPKNDEAGVHAINSPLRLDLEILFAVNTTIYNFTVSLYRESLYFGMISNSKRPFSLHSSSGRSRVPVGGNIFEVMKRNKKKTANSTNLSFNVTRTLCLRLPLTIKIWTPTRRQIKREYAKGETSFPFSPAQG